jgi:hypothetical protein
MDSPNNVNNVPAFQPANRILRYPQTPEKAIRAPASSGTKKFTANFFKMLPEKR